jgi:hypothetical protein
VVDSIAAFAAPSVATSPMGAQHELSLHNQCRPAEPLAVVQLLREHACVVLHRVRTMNGVVPRAWHRLRWLPSVNCHPGKAGAASAEGDG